MSWDVVGLIKPPEATEIDQIPDDYQVPVIGVQSEVISKICLVVPQIDSSDPNWLKLEDEQFSMEISLGGNEQIRGLMFFIYGNGEQVLDVLFSIARVLSLSLLDGATGSFMTRESASSSFKNWRDYRDGVVS